ncbi:RNA polymerase sigma factor [Pseudidiomarina sp. CB1]|uniref:RNA polymerase sigma factor n=1 Tax=Pseudidiomarina sp. CB1 TaxID=2972484 RepID=UPI0021635765|nr:RNA polymerase sigma factor [Pseudidiomarina sp. CB1]
MSEKAWVSKARRAASHGLIERLLAEHTFALRRFIRVRLHSEQQHECDDVLQDVYMRLSQIEDLPVKLAGRLDTTRNYLLQIASNLIIDRARRAQVRKQADHVSNTSDQEEVPLYCEIYSPERSLANKRKLQRIERALQKLRPTQRKAFLLHRVEGLSYREISDQLGLSVSTIEKHIAAALSCARQAIAKEEHDE